MGLAVLEARIGLPVTRAFPSNPTLFLKSVIPPNNSESPGKNLTTIVSTRFDSSFGNKMAAPGATIKIDWTLWRRKLRAVFSSDGSSTVPVLRTPLGEWKSSLDVREWPTLMSGIQDSRQAFRRLPDGTYEVFQVESARNSTRSFLVPGVQHCIRRYYRHSQGGLK
jgi:hypothetical protein